MNRVSIIGNLTKDPTLNTTPNGKSVCNFTVAVNRRRQQNAEHPEADYFRVAVWEKTGEACAKYLAKGRKVFVSGEVRVSTYTDNSGVTHGNLEIPFADEVEFLTPRVADGGVQEGTAAGAAPAASGGFTPVDAGDDLPF